MASNKNHPVSSETKKWLNTVYDGVCIVDKELQVVFWNKGAEHITGYTDEEMVNSRKKTNFLGMTDENGHAVYSSSQQLWEVISNGEPHEHKVYFTHKLGYRFPVRLYLHPITDRQGHRIGAIEIFRDISIEEKVQHIEERYKRVIRQFVSETTYKEVIRAVNNKDYGITAYNRNLTILFMDIVGFTSLSEQLAPEKVVDMLNAYFTQTSRIIEKNRGDIDKFLGDGVMAIFKDPEQAVQASLDMLPEGLKTLNRELKARKLPVINLRIGINTGNLIQGNIGSRDRKDWTVVGDVVNTAYRIEESAEPGHILISRNTIGRLSHPEKYQFVKELSVKGKSNIIKVYSPVDPEKNKSKTASR